MRTQRTPSPENSSPCCCCVFQGQGKGAKAACTTPEGRCLPKHEDIALISSPNGRLLTAYRISLSSKQEPRTAKCSARAEAKYPLTTGTLLKVSWVTGGNVLIWVNLEEFSVKSIFPSSHFSVSPLLSLCGSLAVGP